MSESVQGSESKWNAHQDLIIKLQVKGEENVRRIHADRLRNKEGLVCYNKLIRWALRYSPMVSSDPTFVGKWESDWKALREQYEIRTFYKDEDGDEIVFSTNMEFIQGIQIFAKHSLEDTESVISTLEGTKPAVFRCAVSFEKKKPTVVPKETADENPENLKAQKEAQIHQAFESFVSVLAGALVALQGSLAVASANMKKAEEEFSNRVRRAAEEGGDNPEIKALTSRLGASFGARKEEAPTEQRSADPKKAAEALERAREVAERMVREIAGVLDKKAPAEAPFDEKDPLASFDKNFVHARHTCDGCHKSPIVGIRYHSTNIPDFDYCAKCKAKNTDKSIEFAPEQLPRDKKYQPRGRGCRGRSRGFPNRVGRGVLCGPGRHAHYPAHRNHSMQNMNEEDALKEAIRRSLAEEAAIKEAAKESKQEETKKVTEVAKEEDQAETKQVTESKEADAENAPTPKAATRKVDCPANDQLEQATQLVDAVGMTVGQCAMIVGSVISDIVDGKSTDGNSTVSSLSHSKMASSGLTTAFQSKESVPEPAKSTESVAETSVAKSFPIISCNVGLEAPIDGETFLVDDSGNEVQSFLADDDGNEVESFHTSEKEQKATEVPRVEKEESSVESAPKEDVVKEPLVQEIVKEAIIVPTDASVSSEEDWDVLDDDDEGAMTPSFAKLGSTMHSQDLTRSQEELASNDDEASIVSGVSSVESFDSKFTVSSDDSPVSSILIARWDEELAILRGLGFSDDKKSLNALETIEAANVGVDSDEELSINAVVNFLLNQAD